MVSGLLLEDLAALKKVIVSLTEYGYHLPDWPVLLLTKPRPRGHPHLLTGDGGAPSHGRECQGGHS